MKYSTVRIDITSKKDWRVTFTVDDRDRVEGQSIPNAMGFFHFPVTMSKEEAFESLKNKMIETHLEEIKKLQESVDALIRTTIQ